MNNALDKLSEYIKSLENSEEISDVSKYDLFFSSKDEGTLFLESEEVTRYRETLLLLYETIKGEFISEKTFESLCQRAILYTLDIKEQRREKTFDQRLKVALEELRKSLTAKPSAFQVYYPIGGLAKDGLPVKVGNVTFCVFEKDHLLRFIDILNQYEGDPKEKENRIAMIDEIKRSLIVGQTTGLIEVYAIDAEAAKLLALKELTITLDIINFYSDLIPYQKGYIFLPGEREKLIINVPIITQDTNPTFTYGWEVAGPLMPLSLKLLLETNEKRKFGFSEVSNLLTKKRNNLEDRLISAIQWAGKATIENRKEMAFLLYAISLECLILSDNEKEELTYRLRTRIAHLLGSDLENRKKIKKRVGELYDIRSKIVHSGWYQVTDADLGVIRLYTKSCILRIINDEPFISMESIVTLIDWFDDKILS
jgi:hypothetical protein